MSDLVKFAARVQAFLAFALIGSLFLSTLGLVSIEGYLAISKIAPDDTLKSLLDRLLSFDENAALVGVSFWLARHRPNGDADSSNPTTPADPAKVKP